MNPADRLAWWLAKPRNCDKVYAGAAVMVALFWWLTGDYSPLP